MRISDWSSDVCSSDLCGCLRPPACQKSKPGSCRHGRDRGPARGHRRAVRSGAGWCALPATVAHCVARIAMWRSEEHTSELQSLMRISYAVFCLKKKNNNAYKEPAKHETRDHNV